MGADFEHVGAGDPLTIRADTWNALLDAAKLDRDTRGGLTGGVSLPFASIAPSLTILVENVTGANLPFGGVARLDVEAYTIDLNFGKRPVFKAKKPTGSETDILVAVAEPIIGNDSGNVANGTGNGIGRVVLMGHGVVNINVSNTTHRYAIANANDTGTFYSNATTGFRILGEVNATGNLTLGVLVERIERAHADYSLIRVGNVGTSTMSGDGLDLTLLANGTPAELSTYSNFSGPINGGSLSNSTLAVEFPVGNSSVAIPCVPASLGNAGYLTVSAQTIPGEKTFNDSLFGNSSGSFMGQVGAGRLLGVKDNPAYSGGGAFVGAGGGADVALIANDTLAAEHQGDIKAGIASGNAAGLLARRGGGLSAQVVRGPSMWLGNAVVQKLDGGAYSYGLLGSGGNSITWLSGNATLDGLLLGGAATVNSEDVYTTAPPRVYIPGGVGIPIMEESGNTILVMPKNSGGEPYPNVTARIGTPDVFGNNFYEGLYVGTWLPPVAKGSLLVAGFTDVGNDGTSLAGDPGDKRWGALPLPPGGGAGGAYLLQVHVTGDEVTYNWMSTTGSGGSPHPFTFGELLQELEARVAILEGKLTDPRSTIVTAQTPEGVEFPLTIGWYSTPGF